jgi:hypothetical protein
MTFPTNVVPTHTPPVQISLAATLTTIATCVIPAGTSVSGAIDMTVPDRLGFLPMIVIVPDAWTSAKLTVQMSYTNNGTWHYLHRWLDNTAYTTAKTLNATDALSMDDGFILRGCPFIRFISGTESVPVVQVADRTLTVICGTY